MSEIKIEWDPHKVATNIKKHKVSFKEAATAFSDEIGRVISDPDHSEDEDRFLLLGMSAALRVLVVCHCYRESSSVIRIISARKANKTERAQYGGK